MTATLDHKPIPSHAITVWCDDVHIYACIPGNPPHICAFPLSEAGMSKAANLLRTRHELVPTAQRNYTKPLAHVSYNRGKPPVQTAEQRAEALAVLRKMGIV